MINEMERSMSAGVKVIGYERMRTFAISAAALTVIAAALPGCGPSATEPSVAAFNACSAAIRTAAKNPSAAVIPRVANTGKGDEVALHWPHGAGLQLQNGFGAMLDTTARCYTTPDGAQVTSLIMDGKAIIDTAPSEEVAAAIKEIDRALEPVDEARRVAAADAAEEAADAAAAAADAAMSESARK